MAKARTPTIFTSPQDAAIAFYHAFEAKDVDAMMSTWAEDEDIVCVHPAGQRLAGQAEVREVWRQMFAGGPGMRVRITQQVVIAGVMLEVRSVHENITVAGEQRPRPPMVATNVYLRTAAGWRMIAHHASPAPGQPAAETPPAGPKILH